MCTASHPVTRRCRNWTVGAEPDVDVAVGAVTLDITVVVVNAHNVAKDGSPLPKEVA